MTIQRMDHVGIVVDDLSTYLRCWTGALFKTELIADRVWQTRDQLEFATTRWIGWYNQRRLHSSLRLLTLVGWGRLVTMA